MHPIVIIGSGMAAYAVARELRKIDPETALVMICADDARNYAKPTLSNALVGNKAPAQIALGDAEKMSAQLNMHIMANTWVKGIDAEQQLLELECDGQTSTQAYAKLVLALGATPIRAALQGNAASQVHVVNNLNDYTAFRAELDQKAAQRVAILGAGLIGCEFANDLQQSGHQATVIDLAEQPLARLLPQDVATQFQAKLQAAGIEFELGTTVSAIEQVANTYQVQLSNGKCLNADVVLSAIGLRANTELAQQAGIEVARGVVTNTLLQTNLAHIYAVGDCAEVNGTLLPYVMPIMQQARALAKTLSGNPTHVHYPAMPVAVKTPAAPLTVLPVVQGVEVSWQLEAQEDGLIAKAFDQTQTLRGFVLLGATAAKQRLSLTKLVPDLIPAQAQ
ncbi:FAD-dependent oxidoreductase [uncultured Acinetobacter sp.]|uniref:FAD-dependent oxidoreductase n=1 Tax=uncultured Acinetobacter sp. TaxID=165433 RepID=UPI0026057D60|nr:FAD-dependent oxidoreductase [uncultured Acinetobacter sp.]